MGGSSVTLNTDKKVYWNSPDREQRRRMAGISMTSANLKEAIVRAFEVLSTRPDLNKTLQFYEGNLALQRIISTSLKQAGDRCLQSLLRNEAIVVEDAFQAGCQRAEFRKSRSKKPSEAIEALVKFGANLTKAFNENISSVYGGGALRLLGTLVFMEAARGLVKPRQLNGKPNAMLQNQSCPVSKRCSFPYRTRSGPAAVVHRHPSAGSEYKATHGRNRRNAWKKRDERTTPRELALNLNPSTSP